MNSRSDFFKSSSLFSAIIVLILSLNVSALVDMNNAGYSNAWVDLEVPGTGYNMRVLRVYKSRTLFNGIFGFGQCSEFETKLSPLPEGNIVISECGDGQEIIFAKKALNKADVDTAVKAIIAKMKADKKFTTTSADFYKKIESNLYEDTEYRNNYARQYGLTSQIEPNTKYLANGKEVENVVFHKTHYIRTMSDGGSQRFDLDGRLTTMFDKNGNFVKFEYQKDLLTEVVDNNARKLSFKYFPNKKVKSVSGPNGLLTEYKYNQQEDLIWNRNAWSKNENEVYTFEYNEFHNMTKATWPNKKFIVIKYDNVKDWVVSFTDLEKCVESYKYDVDPKDAKYHYWSTVSKVCGKKTVASNRFEFWHRQLPTGKVILSRLMQNVNGSVKDITYHELFGKPITIKTNSEKIDFEYYADGLIRLKTTPYSKFEYTYHADNKRVATVKTSFINEKGKIYSTRLTSFKYDSKGNLNYAENSDGQKITLSYDPKGRMQTIIDQAKKVVKIDYEERFGKPKVVTRPGLGSIKVSYKPNGDIAKVDSPDGATVASQVASTFNNLLDIIAPASQELYL